MAFPSNMLPAIDNKTIVVNDNNELIAKDIVIDETTNTLASEKGQIGTPPIQSFTKTSDDDAATLNLNDDKWWVNGEYTLYLRGGIINFIPSVNNVPALINGNYSARLKVMNVYNTGNGIQEFSLVVGGRTTRTYRRTCFLNSDNTISYYSWYEVICTSNLGDGIRNTNGIISVPEMQGATASSASTTGLVPVATAINRNAVLSGKGEFSYNQYGNILNLTSGMSLIVDAQSNYLMVSTSGNITIMQKNDYYVESNRLITLVFKATATTVLAWPPSWKWLNETKYSPTWGTAGNTLIVEVWILGKSVSADRIVLASAIYNSEDV